jgi:hypothetical protein
MRRDNTGAFRYRNQSPLPTTSNHFTSDEQRARGIRFQNAQDSRTDSAKLLA